MLIPSANGKIQESTEYVFQIFLFFISFFIILNEFMETEKNLEQ